MGPLGNGVRGALGGVCAVGDANVKWASPQPTVLASQGLCFLVSGIPSIRNGTLMVRVSLGRLALRSSARYHLRSYLVRKKMARAFMESRITSSTTMPAAVRSTKARWESEAQV